MERFPEVLRCRVVESELTSGKQIFTASFDELPGVVCEGDTEDQARSELLAMLDSLRDRLDLPRLGIVSAAVHHFRWDSYMDESGNVEITFGTDPEWENDPSHEFREAASAA